MSTVFDAGCVQLATWARQRGLFELALAYEEARYLGVGGRVMRGNLEERASELTAFALDLFRRGPVK